GVGSPLAVLVDDRRVEIDRHGDRGLDEGGVALAHGRNEQNGEERQADADGREAIEAEAGLGGVATLESDVAAGGSGAGGIRRGRHGSLGHSYCSRYLRTI